MHMKMIDMSPVFIRDTQRRERKGTQGEMGHLLFHFACCRVLHGDGQRRVSENELNFHVNEISFFFEEGCAPRLALRKRLEVIRKWPIKEAYFKF